MKSLKQLNEEVTQTKLVKMNNTLKQRMNEDPSCKKKLLELDMNNDDEVGSFIKEVFGEPSGIYKNTYEEQKKVLNRMYDDYHKEQGSMIRPEYSELGMEP